jgi:hypothetical protein
MCPTLTCLALALVGGVDSGYQPLPDGKTLELIVQIDPATFRTIGPGDPISAVVPSDAQKFPVSKITVAVENGRPPRKLPQPSASIPLTDQFAAPNRGASSPPRTAPDVPARPLPSSTVMPATATSPLPSNGPSLGASAEQGPAHVGPPTGTPVAPTTTNEQTQGAADERAGSTLAPGGNPNFPGMEPANSGKATAKFNSWEFVLYLAIIALMGSNGYVGWLFYDARQRYLALLDRKFATAS